MSDYMLICANKRAKAKKYIRLCMYICQSPQQQIFTRAFMLLLATFLPTDRQRSSLTSQVCFQRLHLCNSNRNSGIRFGQQQSKLGTCRHTYACYCIHTHKYILIQQIRCFCGHLVVNTQMCVLQHNKNHFTKMLNAQLLLLLLLYKLHFAEILNLLHLYAIYQSGKKWLTD